MATAQTSIHHGPAATIPDSASPGLLFLKAFLRVLDSLDAAEVQNLTQFVTPDATFAINGGAPVPTGQVLGMLAARGEKLARFGHEVHVAWDVDSGSGSGSESGSGKRTRTLMYESTSLTVFKGDAEGVEIRVREFNVVELVSEEDGWKARELRTFMDAGAVYKHAQKLAAAKTE